MQYRYVTDGRIDGQADGLTYIFAIPVSLSRVSVLTRDKNGRTVERTAG